MITNKNISLAPESQIRQNALNTIKYTLLLDYDVARYDENKTQFIENVMEQCQNCCVNLFEDSKCIEKGAHYHFFGFACPTSEIPLSAYAQMDQVLSKKTNNALHFYNNSSEFYFHNIILHHCVLSCYHAIITELSHGKKTTSYRIVNNPTNFSLIANDNYTNKANLRNSREKSSTASDFNSLSKSHLKVLPFFANLRTLDQFNHLWFCICNLDARIFKSIYAPTSKSTIPYRLKKIQELSEWFQSTYDYSSETTPFNLPSNLYHMYLAERIFNPRLFYSLCSMMVYISNKHTYRIDQPDFLPTLTAILNLPNIFSRQHMLVYAMLHIDVETLSTKDFWFSHRKYWEDNIMVDSAHKEDFTFNLSQWKRQFLLFSNYLSSFVIPVYEWCFTITLLETIEKNYQTVLIRNAYNLPKAAWRNT